MEEMYSRRSQEWFNRHIEKAMDAKNDVDRENRLKSLTCPYCFYLSSGFGGAAMTPWKCELCGKTFLAGSTYTPALCDECALKENRCRQCGDKQFDTT